MIWGGEFGRTAYSQGILTNDNDGRDHHPRCFTTWMAGAGIKPGITYGATDEFGYNVVESGVHVQSRAANTARTEPVTKEDGIRVPIALPIQN